MRRRTAAIVAGAAAVVVVAATAIGVWVATRPSDPTDIARAYLGALERGDARAAVALVVGGESAHPQLVPAFAGATTLVEETTVGDVRVDGDLAQVVATGEIGGAQVDLPLSLEREGGDWRVRTASLGTPEIVPTVGTAVLIGEAVVPAGPVPLLPAGYEISGAPAGLVEGTASLIVTGDPGALSLETRLTPAAEEQAQEQIDAYARGCTAGGDTIPPACGLRIPWAADLATASAFAYRVERTPVVRLSDDATSFVADGGVVVATVTGRTREGGEAAVTYRDDAWTLRGSVTLDAEGMTLAVR